MFLSILLFSCHISYRSDCCPLFHASSILLIHWRRRGLMLRLSQFSLSFFWTHDLGCVKWTACAVCRLALSSPREKKSAKNQDVSLWLWYTVAISSHWMTVPLTGLLFISFGYHLQSPRAVPSGLPAQILWQGGILHLCSCSSVWFITTFLHFRFLLLHFTALVRLHSLQTHMNQSPLTLHAVDSQLSC